MKFCALNLFMLLHVIVCGKTTVCYLPIKSDYIVAIKPERVLSHKDLTCKDFLSDSIGTTISKLLEKLGTRAKRYEQFGGDYRVYVSVKEGSSEKIFYMTPFGYMLYNGKIYKPNKRLMAFLADLLKIEWR